MKKLSIKFLFIFLLLSISVVSISYFSNNLNSNKDIKAKDYKKVTAVSTGYEKTGEKQVTETIKTSKKSNYSNKKRRTKTKTITKTVPIYKTSLEYNVDGKNYTVSISNLKLEVGDKRTIYYNTKNPNDFVTELNTPISYKGTFSSIFSLFFKLFSKLILIFIIFIVLKKSKPLIQNIKNLSGR